jgi:hypothetical protein
MANKTPACTVDPGGVLHAVNAADGNVHARLAQQVPKASAEQTRMQ